MVKTGNPERYDILIYDMAGSILKQFADMEDGQVDISDLLQAYIL